ncbi:phosphatidylglycerophosphatase A family protein [Gorillibacterium sp. sgz5001074]|uniref:phosphatidylglycerophosphatase A family protein n=1 Tax=Gorillibacterium sp. sgz5001074 TaxID=3446695 RepID=UPI003F678EF2
MKRHVHSSEVRNAVYRRLEERGVTLEEIAEIVYEMQVPYQPELKMETCMDCIKAVLDKREVQHAVLVGIELDVLAEKGLLSEPLQSLIETDEGLFGIDETIALGAAFMYGSISATTFGHLDKHKIGVIKRLDTKHGNGVHTFLDDLVGAIAASASSRIAHQHRDRMEREYEGQQLRLAADPQENAG